MGLPHVLVYGDDAGTRDGAPGDDDAPGSHGTMHCEGARLGLLLARERGGNETPRYMFCAPPEMLFLHILRLSETWIPEPAICSLLLDRLLTLVLT